MFGFVVLLQDKFGSNQMPPEQRVENQRDTNRVQAQNKKKQKR